MGSGRSSSGGLCRHRSWRSCVAYRAGAVRRCWNTRGNGWHCRIGAALLLLLHLHLKLELLHLKLLQLLHHAQLLLHHHGSMGVQRRTAGRRYTSSGHSKGEHPWHESHHSHTWQASSRCHHRNGTLRCRLSARKEHRRELWRANSTVATHLKTQLGIISEELGVEVASHFRPSCHSCKSPSIQLQATGVRLGQECPYERLTNGCVCASKKRHARISSTNVSTLA